MYVNVLNGIICLGKRLGIDFLATVFLIIKEGPTGGSEVH